MPIGLFTDCLRDLSFEAMLDWCAAHQIETIELGTGNFSPASHCNPELWLESDSVRMQSLGAIAQRGLSLAALNCSGNLLDPDPERRARAQTVFRQSVLLAEKLDVPTVVTMSGCPGEPDGLARYPNWVTCYWQPEFQPLLEWQWNEVINPFWHEAGRFAAVHGVRLAIEMHPGQVVYNTRTFARLRECGGDAIGANLDPSHLIWQGIDPLRVIAALGEAVFHVHAKDCRINDDEMALNGGLETRLAAPRSWEHCIPGEGHDETFWHKFAVALTRVGYDGPLSIEYAGRRADVRTGTDQAVALLRRVR